MLNYSTFRLILFSAAISFVIDPYASAQLIPDWDIRREGVDGFYFSYKASAHLVTDSQGAVYVSNSTLRVQKTDIQTVKYAPDGTEVWTVTYDGPSENMDTSKGIIIDSAGDILVLGNSECDFLVIKYDASDGSVIWVSQHDGGECPESPTAFTTDDVGNIYVTGPSRPPGFDHQEDFYTYKMDSAGNVLWTATYDGPGQILFGNDIPVDIAVDSNGDVFVTGRSNDPGGHPDYLTIKYRGSDGSQLWLNRYHLGTDTPIDMLIDSNDNVYVTGLTQSGIHGITTIKYRNTDGLRLWVVLDTPSAQNFVTSLAVDSRGDIYLAGRADPDTDESNRNDNAVVISHRASDGARLWTTLYGESIVGHYDAALDINIDASDNVYISGETSSFGSWADMLILQYDATTGQIMDQGTYDVPTEMAMGKALALDLAQNVIVSGTTRADPSGFIDFLTLKYPGMPANVTGDLDGDGVVSTSDLLILFSNWGPCPPPEKGDCPADLDGDGVVNTSDLLILFANWG
ncbi:MAG: SBBP repeat-containing protein [Planctomycetes bacterium]|nr:SBBP repeat-containing protein [Planctomycetota bacterium]